VQAAAQNEISAAKERIEHLRREVSRVYIGTPRALDLMIVSLLARGHVLLEGVPGVAKTTLVKAFAVALGCSARRIQFTPAKTQSALLEAMQERQVTIEGDRFELPNPFLVLATQNPVDLEGTYPLPEAQIDRFLVRIPMGYPSTRDEVAMLRAFDVDPPVARAVLSPPDVISLQSIASRIHVEEDLLDYAVGLCAFTRSHPRVALGGSPRASLALLQAAKAYAMMNGKSFVSPDDVRAMAANVLAHRLVLVADAEQDAKARSAVVEEALAKVGYRRGVRAV
jgi:MoxR-like ATPase